MDVTSVDNDATLLAVADKFKKMRRAAINDLPDSDFAFVESGGKRDSSGKTVPRSLRHLPIHDAAHVRNALARLNQVKKANGQKLSPSERASALRKIMSAAKKFKIDVGKEKTKASKELQEEFPEYFEALASLFEDEEFLKVLAEVDQETAEEPDNKETKMSKKKNGDPLAALREMRTEFSKDESKKEYLTALDQQIASLEESMKSEKEEFEAKFKETVELANTLKSEVDTLKAANEEQKVELEKVKTDAESRVEAERLAKRKAEFESTIANLKDKKKIYPPQIEIFRKYAEQPISGTTIAKFTKVDKENKPVIDKDGNEVMENHTIIDFGVELLLAMPDDVSPQALEQEATGHGSDASEDKKRADMKLNAYKTGIRLQYPNASPDELKKLIEAGQAQTVSPDA